MTLFRSVKFYFITFFILANLLLILSNLPMFVRFRQTPPDRVYQFVHTDWAHDYYLYLSVITQGSNGSWLYRDPYTTESTKPGIFYLFFTTIGQTAKIFHLSSIDAYHIMTLLGFELFISLIFILSLQILGGKIAFWASLMSILGTISPTLLNTKINFPINMPWWIVLDAFERFSVLPHYAFSQALLLLAIILFIKFFRTLEIKYALFSAIIIFIGGFILPSVLIPAFTVLPLLAVFYIIYNSLKKEPAHLVIPRFNRGVYFTLRNWIPTFVGMTTMLTGTGIIMAFAFADYLLMKYQVKLGFPWDQWTKWGIGRWNYYEPTFDSVLFLSFGILPLLSIPAIIQAFRKKNMEMIFVSLWAVLPFAMLPFATTLEIAKIRLVQMANFVPFGILSAYTIFQIVPKFGVLIMRFAKQCKIFEDRIRNLVPTWIFKKGQNEVKKTIQTTHLKTSMFYGQENFTCKQSIPFVLILLFFISTLPVSLNILNQRILYVRSEPIYDHIYLPDTSLEAVKYIRDYLPKNSVILANEKMGIIIPAYAPVISYFGHTTQTMDYGVKEKNMKDFFSGVLKGSDAKEFLIKNGIGYVYYGWQEKELGDISKYDFLKPVFTNDKVIIYIVQQ